MKRAYIVAGLAGVFVLSATAPARAQEPQTATVYRTSLGGGLFGGGAKGGGADRSILLAGVITTGAAYAGSVVGGMIALATLDFVVLNDDLVTYVTDGYGARQATEMLYIPIVGPWIALSENLTALDRCEREALACAPEDYWMGNVGFIVAGASQAVGVSLIIWGLLQRAPAGEPPRRDRVILSGAPAPGGGVVVLGGAF